MKKLVFYLISLTILFSCSPDDPDSGFEITDINFIFEVTGALNKTLSGQGIVYNETTTDAVNFEGNTIEISTLLFVAEDENSEDTVIFSITTQGVEVNSGNYGIGTDILTFYNVFLNFSGDKGDTIAYQSESGAISIDSKGIFAVSGSVDVLCPDLGGGDNSIQIKGSFSAENAKF